MKFKAKFSILDFLDNSPDPIVGFSLDPIAPMAFGQLMPVTWDMTNGTNVSVAIFYNDIFCCNSSIVSDTGSQCDCLVWEPSRFDIDGVVDIRAEAWNIISNTRDSIQVAVLKPIDNVSFSMLTSYAEFGAGVEGRGNLRNVFPAEYPVKFNCSFLHGPVIVVEWTFSCGSSGVTQENDLFFDKSFPSSISQLCNITLVLKNNISTANTSRTIDLRQSIIFTSMTNDGPLKQNRTVTFTISLETFGTDTCMTVDMGDNTSLLVFGDPLCEQNTDVSRINPNILMEPRFIFTEKAATTQQITINHRYPKLGTYAVKMNASNAVSMVTGETVAVVLEYDCFNPNVTIRGAYMFISLCFRNLVC